MIQTFKRKRIDILVDAPLCDWLIEQAGEAGIAHHSLLPVHSGLGRTGAWRDDDGYYWFEGRIDDVIKSSGYRIGPFEVESALMTHEAVVE